MLHEFFAYTAAIIATVFVYNCARYTHAPTAVSLGKLTPLRKLAPSDRSPTHPNHMGVYDLRAFFAGMPVALELSDFAFAATTFTPSI